MNRLDGDNLAFFRDIPRRAVAAWPLKLRAAAVLVPLYCVPYFLIQRIEFASVIPVPPTPLDRAIPFDPRWVCVYLSLYAFQLLPPLLDAGRHLRRYVAGMAAMAVAAFVCFVVVPVAGPRPPHDDDGGGGGHALYALLVSLDTPLNAFPSLHVGIVVFTLLFAAHAFRDDLRRGAGVLLGVLVAWGLLICYATLATKQHYAVDVPAGALLAWACHRWSGQAERARVRMEAEFRLVGSLREGLE